LSCPVSEVRIEQGTLRGVVANGTLEPFSKVISTIPMPFVPRLMPGLPEAVLERYRALKNIAVVCVVAKLARPVSENFWLNVNDPDMDIPGLVEYSNLRPVGSHIVYVPFYMPGEHPKYQAPDEAFLDRVKRYLQRINPALTDRDFVQLRASRYRFAQPICQPGHLERLPPAKLPVAGLWAADTSFYYPEDRGISESIEFGRRLASEAAAA
jgi:protoporphyrinogen oxidase